MYLLTASKSTSGDIYAGQSNDIHRRLTEHLEAGSTCINRNALYFSYEVIRGGEHARRRREKELIDQYDPLCN